MVSGMTNHPDQLSMEKALVLLKRLIQPGEHDLINPTMQQLKQILCIRKRSLETGDRSMDNLLFNIGKLLDEKIRDGAPESAKKRFLLLTDYFHKLESAAGHLNHLAFMGSNQLDVEQLVELKQDMELFETFETGFFKQLFVDELLKSPLLDSYGRRRIKVLVDGLTQVQMVKMQKSDMKLFDMQAVQAIIIRLQVLETEERLFMVLAEVVAEQSKLNQAAMSTPQGREVIQRVATIELRQRHTVVGDIPDSLFQKAFELVKLEAIYSNAILPQIVRGNHTLRQDFIKKTGLDLFYIEDLEDRYFEQQGVSRELLDQMRGV
jgi:uncharacterized protein (TIGR04442 family)